MPRYVPKTYNNRRLLRIIIGTIIALALSVVILFLILFFILQQYVNDEGQLILPWDPEFQGTVVEEQPEDPSNEEEDFPDEEQETEPPEED